MFKKWLSDDRIRRLLDAAVAAGTPPKVGLDPQFAASLTDSGPLNAQLYIHLHEMNRVTALRDGSVPLRQFLEAAHALAGNRPEADVFAAALNDMGFPVPQVAAAAPAANPQTPPVAPVAPVLIAQASTIAPAAGGQTSTPIAAAAKAVMTGAQAANADAPREMMATVAFLVIPDLAEQGGADAFALITAMHRRLREDLLEAPREERVAGLRVLSAIGGAIVIVPDDWGGEVVGLLAPVAAALADAKIAVRTGIARGMVEWLTDADGPKNAVGVCINTAVRLATSEANAGLFVDDDTYAAHVGPDQSKSHWLFPKKRAVTKIKDKHEVEYTCVAPPEGVWRAIKESDAPPGKLPKATNTMFLAYDLPEFSRGDQREITSRYKSIVGEVDRLLQNGTLNADRMRFSPGGDGGVLAIEGVHLGRAGLVASELEALLRIESLSKAGNTGVQARIGVHYGPVYLYENAEGILRPTGAALFDADALTSDRAAKPHRTPIFSHAVIDAAAHGSAESKQKDFIEIDRLSRPHGREIRRYVRRSSVATADPSDPSRPQRQR